MKNKVTLNGSEHLLKNLGLPTMDLHHSQDHADFIKKGRRTLIIGPMGSGKTEFASRIWRDSRVALEKSDKVGQLTTTKGADRRRIFYIRSILDKIRFPEYPDDALAHRGGYEKLGKHISFISNSYDLENLFKEHESTGTWIIDEASFYDERIVYLIRRESEYRGCSFFFPTLILNFRREIFNQTARLLLETATDIIPLTAYCEHSDCIKDSFYTYRYYTVEGKECPALYFDPLIIVGGDVKKEDPVQPNYCTRCEKHHYLPGKEYTFLTLKPLGEEAASGRDESLLDELYNLKNNIMDSKLYESIKDEISRDEDHHSRLDLNALEVPYIAEKALLYLYCEQNLVDEYKLRNISNKLNLDRKYLSKSANENGRRINLEQDTLFG